MVRTNTLDRQGWGGEEGRLPGLACAAAGCKAAQQTARDGRGAGWGDVQAQDSMHLRRTLDTRVELLAGSGIYESGDRMQVPQVTFIVWIPCANANQSGGKKLACRAISQTASGLGELGLFSTPAPILGV